MQLLELSTAELEFLESRPATTGHMQQRLTQRLAATLTARLRLPMQLHADPHADAVDAQAAPVWQPDGALATLWLTRRLGGQRVVGTASFVPHTLIRTLDEVLAECWLDSSEHNTVPVTLAWQVLGGTTQARLALRLPDRASDMAHWAQGVIRHV